MSVLSEKEERILGCIEHRAEQEIPALQELLGYRGHTLRYTINTLTERGLIIGKAPFINAYALGYNDFTIFFSPSAELEAKQDTIQAILQSPNVSWMGKLGGDYQYGLSVYAQHVKTAYSLLNQLSDLHGDLFSEKSISVRVNFTAYGRKYLAPDLEPRILALANRDESAEFDQTDLKILQVLSNFGSLPLRELGAKVGLSGSSVAERIKKLEDKNIIVGYIYRYNLHPVGMQTYRLLLYAKRVDSHFSAKIEKFAREHPHVLHFIECMGAWNYELGVEVRRSEDITAIRDTLQQEFGDHLGSIKMYQIFRHLKFSSYPFG